MKEQTRMTPVRSQDETHTVFHEILLEKRKKTQNNNNNKTTNCYLDKDWYGKFCLDPVDSCHLGQQRY